MIFRLTVAHRGVISPELYRTGTDQRRHGRTMIALMAALDSLRARLVLANRVAMAASGARAVLIMLQHQDFLGVEGWIPREHVKKIGGG
jgi:hypothetical protein